MNNLALGMIEAVGLTAAVEAADVACKSANVELVGYELAKGGGMVTVKVVGQVGAVNAAVAAAKSAAGKVSRVIATSVIPRPNSQLSSMVYSDQTVGYTPPSPPADQEHDAAVDQSPAEEQPEAGATPEATEEPGVEPSDAAATPDTPPSDAAVTGDRRVAATTRRRNSHE